MRIAREEIFGPVLSAISFTDEDEAIADRQRHDVRPRRRRSGRDDVNRAHRAAARDPRRRGLGQHFDTGDISAPFGGFKQSGFGRDKSIHSLEKYSDLKTVWIALRS